MEFTYEFLNECFKYENGKLFWKKRPREHFKSDNAFGSWNTRFSGKEAGSVIYTDKEGVVPRVCICVSNRRIYRNVAIWIMHNGSIPSKMEVDHKNTDTIDDKIENLRLATRSQNACNQGITRKNTSGLKGVSWCNTYQAWVVYVGKNRSVKYIGRFKSKFEAAEARAKAALEIHGEFYR